MIKFSYEVLRYAGAILFTVGLDKIHEGLPWILIGVILYTSATNEKAKWIESEQRVKGNSPP